MSELVLPSCLPTWSSPSASRMLFERAITSQRDCLRIAVGELLIVCFGKEQFSPIFGSP